MQFKDQSELGTWIEARLEESRQTPVDAGDEVPGADLSFNHLYHLARIQEKIGYHNRSAYLEYLEKRPPDHFWEEYIRMYLLVKKNHSLNQG